MSVGQFIKDATVTGLWGKATKAQQLATWGVLANAAQAINGRSPWDLPANPALATVTSPATTPAPLTRGYAPFVAISSGTGISNSATIIKDVFLPIGGAAKNYGNNLAARSVTSAAGNVGGTDTMNGSAFEVMCDAAQVAFRFFRQGATLFRVAVNGQYVSSGAQSFDTTNSGGVVVVDFGGVRTIARIRVEVSGGCPMTAAWVGPTENLWKPQDASVPNVAVIGDSYTVRGSATFNHFTWSSVAASMLGWRCTAVALGGTGYIEPGAEAPFAARLDNLLWQNFDAVLVAGGINDKNYAAADITAAALSLFQGIRARLPAAPVMVLGPWPGSSSSPNSDGVPVLIPPVENAIQAAVTAWRDANVEFIPTVAAPGGPLFFGSGFVTGTTGNGNNDLYSVADRTHVNDAGSIYAGRWAANAIRSKLTARMAL